MYLSVLHLNTTSCWVQYAKPKHTCTKSIIYFEILDIQIKAFVFFSSRNFLVTSLAIWFYFTCFTSSDGKWEFIKQQIICLNNAPIITVTLLFFRGVHAMWHVVDSVGFVDWIPHIWGSNWAPLKKSRFIHSTGQAFFWLHTRQ